MRCGIFGGSFDPVHSEHVKLVERAIEALSLDKVYVLPAKISPFKQDGALASETDRLEMCKIAFRGNPRVEVSSYELKQEGTSYSYLTCRYFKQQFPNDTLYFLMGGDCFCGFSKWKNPKEILGCVQLAVYNRKGQDIASALKEFQERFGREVIVLPFAGEAVSSTRLRVELAFGKTPAGMDGEVLAYLRKKGLYSHPAVLPALSLEKPARQEHSFRVACLAAERAIREGISQEKAILAGALHDCGKYVPLDSPMLEGFVLPHDVPAPVVHQYTGAYLAERQFGITDEEILDAIRYHTSGKENMTSLGKLIFLADMLEEGRDFAGIEGLRAAFEKGLDEGMLACLESQLAFLKAEGKPIYPLTERAYKRLKQEK